MDSDDEDTHPRLYLPWNMSGLKRGSTWIHIALGMLNIAMIYLTISSYAGAGPKEGDTKPVHYIKIKWTHEARIIQIVEIAMCFIDYGWYLSIFCHRNEVFSRVYLEEYTPAKAKRAQRSFFKTILPGNALMFIIWVLLISFQGQYIPLLGNKKLKECVTHNLQQCRELNGTWVCGLIYCCLHFTSLVLDILLWRRMMSHPEGFIWPPLCLRRPRYVVPPGEARDPGVPNKIEMREETHSRVVIESRVSTEETGARRYSDSELVTGGPSKKY